MRPVTTAGLPAVLAQGVALLERAMGYALGSLQLVTPESLDNLTPCSEWDLRALLLHMNESLQALHQAIAVGHLELDPSLDLTDVYADYGDPTRDPVAALRNRACHMVGAWMAPGAPHVVSIADRCVTADVVAAAGAIEVTVHGWDVAAACGTDRPIPEPLAQHLLDLCEVFVDDTDRPHRFGSEQVAPSDASAADRLLALLGRHTPHSHRSHQSHPSPS
jgi:uncharacterized protein (TIGR03086 family)